jgi:hypothetical protein
LKAYLPYLEAFASATSPGTGALIYLATDDSRVLGNLVNSSSILEASNFVVQDGTLLSDGKKPTFSLWSSHRHRLNTETLVDIYAMSQCSFLIHGYSAVAEASIYLNPQLHNYSVNIDDESAMSPSEFQNLVTSTRRVI